MKYRIEVKSDDGDVYAGEGPTMNDAASAFCLTMSKAPEPFNSEAREIWYEFIGVTIKVGKIFGFG